VSARPADWSPLAFSDPTPGNPDEVSELATHYSTTATAIRTAVDALRRIHNESDEWDSKSGDEFRSKTKETADSIDRAYDRYHDTAKALSTYATELRAVQKRADDLLAQAKSCEDDVHSAKCQLDAAGEDEKDAKKQNWENAQQALNELKGKLGPIREDWDKAGDDAADDIDDVMDQDDLNDSTWDNISGAISAIADLAGVIASIAGVLALVLAFTPLGPILGAIALAAGIIALLGHGALALGGKGDWTTVLLDAVGVLSFGAGRALTSAGRGLSAAARGLAPRAMTSALRGGRLGNMSASAAKTAMRSRLASSGITAAEKNAGRAFLQGRVSWVPGRADWKAAFSRPWREIKLPDLNLPSVVLDLPKVSDALSKMRIAIRSSYFVGAIGSSNDIWGTGSQVRDWVGLGNTSPVER
jgi:uncharacterized protein YukE